MTKRRNWKKLITIAAIVLIVVGLGITAFSVFFDQAVIVRKGTVYRVRVPEKVVALTFDDGPSPEWTPKILDELKKAGVKATFFMIGKYVEKYPQIARRVTEEGHDIGNHSYDHKVLIYCRMKTLEREINEAERVIKDVTGQKTHYFRPPKAWLTNKEKEKIKEMGYQIILWTLNSKDWVTFDDKYIVKFIVRHVEPGDIILFHDGGGVFSTEGGNRHETVKTIPQLVQKLREKGYRFVTITELLRMQNNGAQDKPS
ncbi:MAG: polysaccharide deacetylase family protein [candidate division Zixibacteria bacterium]|nr:polysaccharide deacetylase family protein [candidate division Zixibacteria bacterium]